MTLKLFRYEIEDEPFAYGGMGAVYKGIDDLSGGPVVIKVVNKERLGLDDTTLETFFKEAQAGFRLGDRSNHIARVTDIGLEDGTPYMAVEFFDGGNIISSLGKKSLAECREIARQIMIGIYHAHTNKVIHSDVSPDNVLFDKTNRRYALSDFGLLKILETHLVTRGRSLHTGGKPYYMPPAHFFDPDLICESTDIYALGVLYYQICTGQVIKAQLPDLPVVPDEARLPDGTALPSNDLDFIRKCVNLKYKCIEDALADFARFGLPRIAHVAVWQQEEKKNPPVRIRFAEQVYGDDQILFIQKNGGAHVYQLPKQSTGNRPIEVYSPSDDDASFGLYTGNMKEPQPDVYLFERKMENPFPGPDGEK